MKPRWRWTSGPYTRRIEGFGRSPALARRREVCFVFGYCPRAQRGQPAQILEGVIPAYAGIQLSKVKQPCVYILASSWHGTLYVGVTSDLLRRIWQHKNDAVDGFTKKYSVHDLVWYEHHEDMSDAILREKRIKEWKRATKIDLIESVNPTWRDLYPELIRE